jgi:PKD repeat protein
MSVLNSISSNPLCELTALRFLATDSVRFPGASWAWFKDGVQIPGEKDSFFLRNSPTLKDSGLYHAVLSLNGCSDTTNAIRLVMRAKPQASFTINQSNQCRNVNRFVLNGTSTISVGSISAYQWNFGDSSTVSTANAIKTYKYYGNRRIWYRVESNFGCRDSVYKDVVVYPDARASFTVNKAEQCFSGHQFVFKNFSSVPAGGLSYLWSFGDGNNSGMPNPVKTYTADGVYRVLLQASSVNGCKDTVSIPVSVFPQPNAVFSLPASAQCMNGHVFRPQSSSSVSKGSIRHLWLLGDGRNDTLLAPGIRYAAPGTYNLKLRITSNKACTDSAQRQVVVYPSPMATFSPSLNHPCEGDTVQFNSSSTVASGPLTLFWNLAGTSAMGNPVRMAWKQYGAKPLTLIARSKDACDDTFTLSYTVHALPLAGFTVAPQPGCAVNTLFEFTSAASSPDNLPYSVNWNFGDGKASGGPTVQHIYRTAGSFDVVQTVNTQYCQTTLRKSLNVLPEVSAAFVTHNLNRERLRFSALDTQISGYRYDWSSGDGFTGLGKEWAHTYSKNGFYPVRLIVDNLQGCKDTAVTEISMSSPNLKEQQNSLDFYVYPNPTTNRFTYKFRLDQAAEVTVELFDMIGQDAVWSKKWIQAPAGISYEEVDLKQLRVSGGAYVLRIRSGEAEEQVKIAFTP